MIEFDVTMAGLDRAKADLAVFFLFPGEKSPSGIADRELKTALARLIADERFEGRRSDCVMLSGANGHAARRYAVIGLGKKANFNPGALRDAVATAVRKAEDVSAGSLALALPAGAEAGLSKPDHLQAVVEGVLLGNYKFDLYLTEAIRKARPLRRVAIVHPASAASAPAAKEAIRRARVTSEATCLARDLVCEPAGVLHPEEMTRRARRLAKTRGLKIEVLGKRELQKLGMGAFLGVNVGSPIPPQLIHIVYKPKGTAKRKVALVGKGITFDSGGLNLKPTGSIETMKCDMAGAAAVLATLSALPLLGCKAEVHGFLAMTENVLGSRAQKPGDVVRTMSGKTIEINNTDAEGRLVLCDTLSWAQTFKPDVVIDLATLTGACVVALGPLGTGVFGNDRALSDEIVRSADRTGEKMWPMPLYDEYIEMLHSDIADMQNSGGRWGGAITAGLFLREFVKEGTRWAHLDIAGPAFVEKDIPLSRKGGTGHAVRTLLHFLGEQS